ncbi:alkaline phosphatase [Mechercharimyces sp. CAU 1602]|uniref:alkaline phosphatase n=1 Tax=Mechercharimyces sp. CAU 1602 TaxID=2973933 RepID=UPI002162DBB7|nr:alkaline phosphatase [Mechercharimyces sp. CAU 1602]MCS1350171.1 alkaline phosphatase [Mechercharimyces sp. CAU 1602]
MKKRMIALTGLLAITLLTNGMIPASAHSKSFHTGPKAKNVILIVGDGMGQAHRDAIRLHTVGLSGKLAMDKMPVAGFVRTRPADDFLTDSGAAATAMAIGMKTKRKSIGVDADGKSKETALEFAKRKGKATGIVTTGRITDATTAAFAAHVESRKQEGEIARQYIEESQPDVILGGGENFFYPAGVEGRYADTDESYSQSEHGDLVEKAKAEGYQYVANAEELDLVRGKKILGLFANEEMFEAAEEGGSYEPVVPLADMTKKALQTLSKNRKGFFLVIEDEGIDSMSHKNNAAMMLKAGEQLDAAVDVARRFAKDNRDTLVIVVGDHETGGLSIEKVDDGDESGDGISQEDGPFPITGSNEEFTLDWTTKGHTAVNIPLTAMGVGAHRLAGVYENTHIYTAMIKAMQHR